MRTPFADSNISSMQAMMMGVFPFDEKNLTEWQQANAIPPVQGADFYTWQEELADYALPYGLNTFPIQQWGLEDDFVLAVNKANCPLYAKLYDASEYDALCEYLDWAYTSSVEVNSD